MYLFVLMRMIYAKIVIELEPSFAYFEPFLDSDSFRPIDTDKTRLVTYYSSATLENISNVTSI